MRILLKLSETNAIYITLPLYIQHALYIWHPLYMEPLILLGIFLKLSETNSLYMVQTHLKWGSKWSYLAWIGIQQHCHNLLYLKQILYMTIKLKCTLYGTSAPNFDCSEGPIGPSSRVPQIPTHIPLPVLLCPSQVFIWNGIFGFDLAAGSLCRYITGGILASRPFEEWPSQLIWFGSGQNFGSQNMYLQIYLQAGGTIKVPKFKGWIHRQLPQNDVFKCFISQNAWICLNFFLNRTKIYIFRSLTHIWYNNDIVH